MARPAHRIAAACLALAALAPASAPAATKRASRCAALPVTVARSTGDPVSFQDGGQLTVRPSVGVRDLAVSLRRGSRTYATGALKGTTRAATPVRLGFRRALTGGEYRVVVTGRRSGCAARGAASRSWRFSTGSLPVVAARPSAYAGDYSTSMRVVLRSVGGRSVSDVTAALLDAGGAIVGQATYERAFSTSTVLELPLKAPLTAGSYRLRLTGRMAGDSAALRRSQPLALRASASANLPDGAAQAVTTSSPDAGLLAQRVTVDWGGGAHDGRDTAGFEVPGMGYGEVVCRPNAQWIRFYSASGSRTVAMMNWSKKDWVTWREQSLREAVLTPTSGTTMQEGFNKFGPTPEKQSTGTYDGIVSDRGPFGSPFGAGVAPTTLSLAWSWDFSGQGSERCAVSATFVTETANAKAPIARSLSINWTGATNAAGHDGATAIVPGLGRVDATCAPREDGVRWITVTGPGGATVTTRTGSDESVVPIGTGPVAVPLPNNGMVRFAFPGGASLVMSSRWKVNDPDPAANYCHVAAQAIQP